MRVVIAYVPVLHDGYYRFFKKYSDTGTLYIFGAEIIKEFSWLSKEIRELNPILMKEAIESFSLFSEVKILSIEDLPALNLKENEIIMPDEDVCRTLAEKYFEHATITFDSIFLRWDKHNSIAEKPVVPDDYIARDEFYKKILRLTEDEAAKSSDNWRHVGAALVKEGEIVAIAHNAHVPSEHTPYVNGDPRNNFHKGDNIEISSAIHAEAQLIAEAARKGIVLEGADMFVTVFPCPPCAKLIAFSGIKNLYCGGGYAILDGQEVLKAKGVKTFFVE